MAGVRAPAGGRRSRRTATIGGATGNIAPAVVLPLPELSVNRSCHHHPPPLATLDQAKPCVHWRRSEDPSRPNWSHPWYRLLILRYRTDLTAGSLKLAESRILANLLLGCIDAEGWRTALFVDNVLQARSPTTAKRLRTLIRQRLETMGPELWKLVRDGTVPVATHACLAAAVKRSPLLGDFLDLVVREQWRMFAPALSNRLWEEYVEGCRGRDPEMPQWSRSTIGRLRSSVFQILEQAGYVEDTRGLRLQTVHITGEVLRYLQDHDEHYVLRCIQVAR